MTTCKKCGKKYDSESFVVQTAVPCPFQGSEDIKHDAVLLLNNLCRECAKEEEGAEIIEQPSYDKKKVLAAIERKINFEKEFRVIIKDWIDRIIVASKEHDKKGARLILKSAPSPLNYLKIFQEEVELRDDLPTNKKKELMSMVTDLQIIGVPEEKLKSLLAAFNID